MAAQMSDLQTNNQPSEGPYNFSEDKTSVEDTKFKKFEDISAIKNSGKEEDLHRCSEPSKPLKPLLRTLSELEPMASNDSLSKRYMRVFSVVALYW